MSPCSNLTDCESAELACAYATQALAPSEVAAAEAHISLCPDCQREVESLRPVVNQFVSWPTDVLRPTNSRRYAWRFSSPRIDDRKPFPGDYNYGAPGAGDERVWNETGCTRLLVTSTKDILL